jgi:transcriptional regulator with XRE-family HTH domain
VARNEVADLLRQLREEKGDSLRSAARGIGVDASHLKRVEDGDKKVSENLTERVINYYDVDPDRVYLAAAQLPPDIVELLLAHPEELSSIRRRLGHD